MAATGAESSSRGPSQQTEPLGIAIAGAMLNTYYMQGTVCVNSFHPQNSPI